MAKVKCALGKRGRPSHEWNDGKKDRIYCLGRVDLMTDDPLPECLACPDFALAKDFPCCTGLENVWWRLTDKCDPLPMDGVTHWMPLPEPPKEAGKDGR